MIDVPQYSSEGETDTENESPQRKVERPAKVWAFQRKFDSAIKAKEFVKQEKIWGFNYSNRTAEGKKDYYRCNLVKAKGLQCARSIHLLYDCSSDDVLLFRTAAAHTHESLETRKDPPIREDVQMEINRLFEHKLKPKAIREFLAKNDFPVPSETQLRNYLAKIRTRKFGPSQISLGELEKWFNDNSAVPDDEDAAYIVSSTVTYEEEEGEGENSFQFFASTKRLIKQARDAKIIHADATYKLNWQGFPVLVVGTSDSNRHFHHFGLAVCTSEKTKDFSFIFEALKKGVHELCKSYMEPEVLVADAAHSIQNAFKLVFGSDEEIIMCWAHMRRNVSKKIESLVKPENKARVLEDIEKLQKVSSQELFGKATNLFFEKWNTKEDSFLLYFEAEWINSNSNWYEGFRHFTPSTNNCLESSNKVIKDEDTLRERMPMGRFKVVVFEMVEKWSRSYKNNLKKIDKTPKIDLPTWTSAYQWAKSKKKVLSEQTAEGVQYFIPSGSKTEITTEEVKIYKEQNQTSFDQLIEEQFGIWNLHVSQNHSQGTTCSCPHFFKNFTCKHSVGIAIRLGHVKAPAEAKNVPLNQKRKPGRPKKARPALIVQ
jgi:hypothetical protein